MKIRLINRVFCFMLIGLFLFLLTGCNDEPVSDNGGDTMIENDTSAPAASVEPLSMWLPAKTFNSLIWGEYACFDVKTMHRRGSDDLAVFLGNMSFEQKTITFIDDDGEETEKTELISLLPVIIKSGPATLPSGINDNLRKIGYDYIEYGVYSSEYDDIIYITAPYRIVDNMIIIYTQWTYEYIDPSFISGTDAIIEIGHADTIVYEFCFDGRDLLLKRGGAEVRLIPGDFVSGNELTLEHHPNNNSDAFNDMSLILLRIESNGNTARTGVHFDNDKFGYNRAVSPKFELNDDGTMRISWAQREVSFYEFENDPSEIWCRYIWCGGLNGGDGVILIDNSGNVYPYQLSNFDYRHSKLVESLSVDYDKLSDSEIEDLLKAHANVLEGLQDAFDDADIDAEIDELTGRITMDTAILFAVGDASLSSEGRAYLDEFLDAYAAVVLNDENAGAISEIIVEGHTDSDGTYEDNLVLSENRALAVINYCRSRQPELADLMVAKGMSYNQPVYDDNGLEDKPASRRVVFRFILNVD